VVVIKVKVRHGWEEVDNIYTFSTLVITTPAAFLHDINTDFTNEELLVKLFT